MQSRELKDIRSLKYEIKRMKQHLEELEAAATQTTKPIATVPVRISAADKTADVWAEIADLKTIYVRRLLDYEYRISEAEEAMEKLGEPMRTLMKLRYIEGMSWERVAKEMNYSVQHCYRINAEALEKLRVNER